MKAFVITETRTYHFFAPSMSAAKKLSSLPSAINGAHVETERTLTCENTGEEVQLT